MRRGAKSGLGAAMVAAALAPPTHAEVPTVVLDEIVVTADATAATKARIDAFDASRKQIFPTAAASTYKIDHATIEERPQGVDTPFDTLLSQLPGVTLDSAVSRPDVHIRNEYTNVQYRIDGILLPDNVSGLGAIFDTSFVGTLTLLDGALPAQYGLRTSGVIDITPRSLGTPQGSVELYGGSHGTIAPRFDYGGISGNTQFFAAMRGFQNNVGIESATPTYDPIHGGTDQGRAFGYLSTVLSDSARFSVVTGAASLYYNIPDVPGMTAVDPFGVTRTSASLADREVDRFAYLLGALQTSSARFDSQLSVFARYAQVHYLPDIGGGIAFDQAASDVARRSTLTGTTFDAAYRLDARQTIRGGLGFSAEQTNNDNVLYAVPLAFENGTVPRIVSFQDNNSKLGFNIGGYLQDEIKLTPILALNVGARFDQLFQYVTTNQLSPRLGLTWQAAPGTSVHAGYARYFTPPGQSEAATTDIGLARGTTLYPEVPLADPVRPERSHYFDVGADRTMLPGLDVGIDGYLKLATNYIDDGEFGSALVVSQVNYAKSYSQGFEFKAKYQQGGFSAYTNVATGRIKDTGPVSNQYVFDADEYAYISKNYIFADDVQLVTASAGASYRLDRTLISANMVYGSGLRSGFANLGHVPAYTQVNLGIVQSVDLPGDPDGLKLRFDIVNVFDTIYQLRDGTGIGVEAPQYGPRRGFYIGVVKRI